MKIEKIIAGPPIIEFINELDNSILQSRIDISKYKKKNNIIQFIGLNPDVPDISLLNLKGKIKIRITFNIYNTNDLNKIGEHIETYYVTSIEKYLSKANCKDYAKVKFILTVE